jgi:hypothetical protein
MFQNMAKTFKRKTSEWNTNPSVVNFL